jgi:hypothetical protein
MFDKAKMMDWENKPAPIKFHHKQAKPHFELLMKAHDMYVQNSGGGSAGCNKYKSAANMAKIGDKIKKGVCVCVCVCLTSSREGLPFDAVSTAR